MFNKNELEEMKKVFDLLQKKSTEKKIYKDIRGKLGLLGTNKDTYKMQSSQALLAVDIMKMCYHENFIKSPDGGELDISDINKIKELLRLGISLQKSRKKLYDEIFQKQIPVSEDDFINLLHMYDVDTFDTINKLRLLG